MSKLVDASIVSPDNVYKSLVIENEKLKKALEISSKTITTLSDQILGIGLAFKVHGTNLNARFFIETTQAQYDSGRQALKEIEEVLGEN